MPTLKQTLKLSSVAEQLFIWSIIAPLVTELLAPLTRELQQGLNLIDPNELLSPELLADMANRGHISESDASHEAAKSGVDSSRFHRMVVNSGNPPGPGELAEALRRGFIGARGVGEGSTSFEQGILESRIQAKWTDILANLDARLPGPSAAVLADIRSMRTPEEARKLYALFGGDLSQYQLEVDLTGEGPSPVEAGVLANRRIIPWEGAGADKTSFAQAVAESRFKNKWVGAYKALATYRPPPRTVTAMLREGSITTEQATQYLQDYGVPDAAMPAYLLKAPHSGVHKAHEITEGEIIRLYTERGIDGATATKHLTDIGYSSDDAALILAGADLEYQSKLSTATIGAVKQLYLHRHIDRNGAITRLDSVGVKSTYRDALIELWDLEIAAGVKSLTKKEIVDMTTVGLFTQDEGTLKLEQSGYSPDDAQRIMLFAFGAPPSPALAGAPAVAG